MSVVARWQPAAAELQALESPCYLFDPATVVATYRALRETLGTPLMVSFKANPCVDLFVRCAHAFTDGIELASHGELNLVAGRCGAPKFVNTPALEPDLLRAAVAARATLVLDNPHQVDLVLRHAGTSATPVLPLVLRANAASVLDNDAARVQGDHFGMDPAALAASIDQLHAAGLAVRGLHVFAGSYTFDVAAPLLARRALQLLSALNARLQRPMDFLNLGGGFADDWDAASPRFGEYRQQLAGKPTGLTVAHEAGRAIFARGGVFATRVLAVKLLNQRYTVICDGGLAHCFMLAQTEKVMKRLRKPRIVPPAGEVRRPNDHPMQFVGNSCNRSDVIGENSDGLLPEAGDLVVFDGCGSYHSYTPKNFLELRSARHYVMS